MVIIPENNTILKLSFNLSFIIFSASGTFFTPSPFQSAFFLKSQLDTHNPDKVMLVA